MAALPADTTFEPQMSLYLTDKTAPDDIKAAKVTPDLLMCVRRAGHTGKPQRLGSVQLDNKDHCQYCPRRSRAS